MIFRHYWERRCLRCAHPSILLHQIRILVLLYYRNVFITPEIWAEDVQISARSGSDGRTFPRIFAAARTEADVMAAIANNVGLYCSKCWKEIGALWPEAHTMWAIMVRLGWAYEIWRTWTQSRQQCRSGRNRSFFQRTREPIALHVVLCEKKVNSF